MQDMRSCIRRCGTAAGFFMPSMRTSQGRFWSDLRMIFSEQHKAPWAQKDRLPERSRRALSLDHLSRIAPAILGAKVTRPSAPKETTAFAQAPWAKSKGPLIDGSTSSPILSNPGSLSEVEGASIIDSFYFYFLRLSVHWIFSRSAILSFFLSIREFAFPVHTHQQDFHIPHNIQAGQEVFS